MKPGETKGTLKAHTKRLLVDRTDSTLVQFIRYGFVAVAAFAFDIGGYSILALGFNVNPVLAATFSFTLGLIVNYLISIRWVFTQRSRSRRFEIITFFVIGLIGLGLTDLIIWALAVKMNQDKLIAKLIATAIVFFWNFGARKIILFKVKEASSSRTSHGLAAYTSPQRWFVMVALIFGIGFACITPLFKVPDELGHMSRAYGISTGQWLATKQDGKSGSFLPTSFKEVSDYVDKHGTANSVRSLQSVQIVNGHYFFAEHPNMALYSPLVYVPQSTAFIAARTAHLPTIDALYLARIFNVLAYVALWWVAIRLLPFGKWVGVIVGLLPMHVLLAGSMSADPISIALLAVLVAAVLALRSRDDPITQHQRWWLYGLVAAMSLTKLPFPLFLLLLFFVPTNAFGDSKKTWWRTITKLAAIAAIVGGGWLLLAQHTLVPYGPAGVDVAAQIGHPLDFMKAFMWTFFSQVCDGFMLQYVVSIGFVAVSVPVWISYAYAIFIAFAVFPLRSASRATLKKSQKILLAILLGICVLVIGLLLYVSWTPVGKHIIDGIQARYLTPLLLLLVPLLTVRSAKKHEKEGSLSAAWYRWGTLFFLLASLFMSVYFFYIKH